jgi:hypothetical protein
VFRADAEHDRLPCIAAARLGKRRRQGKRPPLGEGAVFVGRLER